MNYKACGYTDIGTTKKTNQDSYLIKIAETSYGNVALIAVADGMGGLSEGELASAVAVRELSSWFDEKIPLGIETMSTSVEGFEQYVEGQWSGLIQDLNLKILQYSNMHMLKLGTTLTAMLSTGARYSIVHVGDTRVYEIENGSVSQLTEDQTYIEREIKAGRLSRAQARRHPKRNVLLQCVGSTKDVRPCVMHGYVKKDSIYLLCSDGFRHVLSEDELVSWFGIQALENLDWGDEVVESDRELHVQTRIAEAVDVVKMRKEKDNITAVLLCVE